jgi:L-arabinose isomerase
MPQFEVTYKVLSNNIKESGAWISSGPSHYTVVVTAAYQGAAEQMVRNMNGGDNHCHIQRAVQIN